MTHHLPTLRATEAGGVRAAIRYAPWQRLPQGLDQASAVLGTYHWPSAVGTLDYAAVAPSSYRPSLAPAYTLDGSAPVLTPRSYTNPVKYAYANAVYSITNVTTDRSYDADATTVDELADVLGTLIADLQAKGII